MEWILASKKERQSHINVPIKIEGRTLGIGYYDNKEWYFANDSLIPPDLVATLEWLDESSKELTPVQGDESDGSNLECGDFVNLVWLIEEMRRGKNCTMDELILAAKEKFTGLSNIKKSTMSLVNPFELQPNGALNTKEEILQAFSKEKIIHLNDVITVETAYKAMGEYLRQNSFKEPKGDYRCLGCSVPESQHNTSCGWENANIIMFPWENKVSLTMTGEEKELRWLISTSPNQLKLSHYFANLTGMNNKAIKL